MPPFLGNLRIWAFTTCSSSFSALREKNFKPLCTTYCLEGGHLSFLYDSILLLDEWTVSFAIIYTFLQKKKKKTEPHYLTKIQISTSLSFRKIVLFRIKNNTQNHSRYKQLILLTYVTKDGGNDCSIQTTAFSLIIRQLALKEKCTKWDGGAECSGYHNSVTIQNTIFVRRDTMMHCTNNKKQCVLKLLALLSFHCVSSPQLTFPVKTEKMKRLHIQSNDA